MEKTFLLSSGELRTPCTLTIPDGMPVQRIVLGVHGITGSSQDDIQRSIAEEMMMFSAATVRFDFPCHGGNPMDGSFFTVHHCVDTLLSVAKWARSQFPHIEDLCIFATGFGAYITLVALEALMELPGNVKLVVQTPSVMMHESLLSMFRLSLEDLYDAGTVTYHLPKALPITTKLYEELGNNIVMVNHPIPMLILHGEADDIIPMEHIQTFRRFNDQAKLVVIPGATHQFLEEGAWDMVLDLTRDWFAFEQVLLCDWE